MSDAPMQFQLRCHRCSKWIGESSQAMELIGVFKDPRQGQQLIPVPRDSWLCKSCKWLNVFQPITTEQSTPSPSWRRAELK